MSCHSDRSGPQGPTIHKFGGTSLASGERIAGAAALVEEAARPVVVVSAMAGVTERLRRLAEMAGGPQGTSDGREPEIRRELDALRWLHHEALDTLPEGGGTVDGEEASVRRRMDELLGSLEERVRRPDPSVPTVRFLDEIWSHGEDLSATLMAAALRARGLRAEAVDARRVVLTDDGYGRAVPRDEETYRRAREHLLPRVRDGVIPVLQGFIGATEEGTTTTLGRGGSDFTAVMVGAALEGGPVTLWTDVDGVYSADPQVVPEADVIGELGYEEAVELAYFGARVVHPAAAKHAVARNVSLHVKNTFRPRAPGTVVRHDLREGPGVAAVAHRPGVTLIRVRSRPLFMAHGFLARVFEVLARLAVPVDLVATSHTSTAFTVDGDESLEEVRLELERVAEVDVLENMATVTVVGRQVGSPVADAVFRNGPPLEPAPPSAQSGASGERLPDGDPPEGRPEVRGPVELISRAGEVSLSLVVPASEAPSLVRYLHRSLVEAPGSREVTPSDAQANP